MRSTPERNNRGIYACGNCGTRGHTRDTCEVPEQRRVVPGFVPSNAGYWTNRAIGACDSCGRPSRRYVYCAKCRARRKARPSRTPEANRAEKQRRALRALRKENQK